MRPPSAALAAVTFALALCAAAPARAGAAADRESARALALRGHEALEAGDYARAIELLRNAEARYHAPTHWLYIARAEFRLGRLRAARASLTRVLEEALPPDAPAPYKEAQTQARGELVEIEALTPTLVIEPPARPSAGTRYSIDGEPLDDASIGRPLPADPGPHVVRAERAGLPAIERRVVLHLGAAEPVRVALAPAERSSRHLVPAIVSFGVGAAGIGVGVAAAIVSMKASDAARTKLGVAEIVGFATGGAGVVAGIVLLATRPGPSAAPSTARREIRIGLGVGAIVIAGDL